MRREPLFIVVANKIIELIQSNYPPGSKIPIETELMEMYGVSRTTIRSAVSSLCSRNILEIRRGDGTYVANRPGLARDPLGIQFLNQDRTSEEIGEMSRLVQPAAAGMAAIRNTADDIERLQGSIKSLEDGWLLYQQDLIDYPEIRTRDSQFHSAVIRASHNHIMGRLDRVFREFSANYREHRNIDVVTDSIEMHPHILEAILEGDSKRAEDLMTKHLKNVQAYLDPSINLEEKLKP